MKSIANHAARRGIAMTEYLIILAVVAISAIAVIGLWGKQIKSTFTRNNAALTAQVEAPDTSIGDDSKTVTIADNMATYTEHVADQ